MTDNNDLKAARELVEAAKRQLAVASCRLEAVERTMNKADIPPEPDEDVLTFALCFDGSRGYRFAAIRTNGKWYTTGRTVQAHGVSWAGLVRWIRAHNVGPVVYLTAPDSGNEIRLKIR